MSIEIKVSHWRTSVAGMYVYGRYEYVKREREEYEIDCWKGPSPDMDTLHEDPEPCYDQAAIDALQARVAELEELQDKCTWHPIETAPKENGVTLLLFFVDYVETGYWESQYVSEPLWLPSNEFHGINWARNNQPTHWMPLPESPK